MTATVAIYLGELGIAAITLITTIWARMSSHKTDESNRRLADLGRTIDRVEDKLDKHVADHARVSFYGARYDKD